MRLRQVFAVPLVVYLIGCQRLSGHSIIGTWVGSITVAERKCDFESTYGADGLFSYSTTLPIGKGKLIMVDRGTYKVKDDILTTVYVDVDWTTEGLSPRMAKVSREEFLDGKSEMLESANEFEPRRLHWISPDHFWFKIEGERVDCLRKVE